MSVTVRFAEFEYYEINHDEEWVRFTATISKGSYYSEVPHGTFTDFRKNRDKFKARVLEALTENLDPCWLDLHDETIH